MKASRRQRYAEKMHFITGNLPVFQESPSSELEKRGIFYTIQTCIEAMIDLVAMAIKDMGMDVREDAENIDALVSALQLGASKGECLKRANGMRDILVHRHSGINENIVLASTADLASDLCDWLDIIEDLLRRWEHDGQANPGHDQG